ncbi:MAG: hypothetical protein JNG90_06345 [Planctomycetaceae bacterium]|nr:hypothetical protein [Planctomycetaceae bacterium]
MTDSLLPPRFLFRLSQPCRLHEPIWGSKGVALSEEYRLAEFERLDGRPAFADLRAAWSSLGLSFVVRVSGKRRPVRCDEGSPAQSDGLHLWIDTRDTHNIHRATRFCHGFVFLPAGSGKRRTDPFAEQLLIHRAKENAKRVGPGKLQVRSQQRVDGYVLEAHLPADALTGFDPGEHPRLGFTYAVRDHELGEQTFAAGGEFPYYEDPSLWGTLELVS